MSAEEVLDRSARFPYDGGAEFWNVGDSAAPPAKDKAHATARGIVADLCDRCGIRPALENIDHDVRAEIVADLAEIIRVGMA